MFYLFYEAKYVTFTFLVWIEIFNDLLVKIISPSLPTPTNVDSECPIELLKAIYVEGLTVISSSTGTEIDRSSV